LEEFGVITFNDFGILNFEDFGVFIFGVLEYLILITWES